MAKSPLAFLDTCSLLDSCWNNNGSVYSPSKEKRFWETELPKLEQHATVVVPARVYDELKKFAKGQKGPELKLRSQHVLDLMLPRVDNQNIEVVGDSNDPFADSIMLSAALKFVTERDLTFITQDRALAKDLMAICQFESINRTLHQLNVKRIDKDGSLGAHRNSTSRPNAKASTSNTATIAAVQEAPSRFSSIKAWWNS